MRVLLIKQQPSSIQLLFLVVHCVVSTTAGQNVILPEAEMKLLWFTPLLIQPIHEPNSFSNVLSTTILKSYQDFKQTALTSKASPSYTLLRRVVCEDDSIKCPGSGNDVDDDDGAWQRFLQPNHLNDAWYEFQRSNKPSFQQLKEFQKLQKYIIQAQNKMKEASGVQPTNGGNNNNMMFSKKKEEEEEIGKLFCWSSVHSSDGFGSFHLPHTHADSTFSSVFYASIPESAGSIWFHDPRGNRPPFDQTFQLEPRQGELILFPSWIVHEVRPPNKQLRQQPFSTSCGSSDSSAGAGTGEDKSCSKTKLGVENDQEFRVSISCNSKGSWKDTSDLNAAFGA
jgi:hypothetical protein